MINFGQICRIMAPSAQDWDDTSGFAIRGTRCYNSPNAIKNGLEGLNMTMKNQVFRCNGTGLKLSDTLTKNVKHALM